MQVKEISHVELEKIAHERNIVLPIEQSQIWANYESQNPDISPLVCISIEDSSGSVCALASCMLYTTHGFTFARIHHGPVFIATPDQDLERKVFETLVAYFKKEHKVWFVRANSLWEHANLSAPVLSTTPYDSTVILDLGGNHEAILAQMKPRGRRDVRKALREAPVTFADETEAALEDFSAYYQVMVETAERDGFHAAPMSTYVSMLKILGQEHARLFAARDKESNKIVAWSMATLYDHTGIHYYACVLNDYLRKLVSDGLLYFEACALQDLGVNRYDLMGIGSDFSPALNSLNMFKTKFTKEITHIAPDRDFPVKKFGYKSLQLVKRLRNRG